jgi:hypothetical protein
LEVKARCSLLPENDRVSSQAPLGMFQEKKKSLTNPFSECSRVQQAKMATINKMTFTMKMCYYVTRSL